MHAVHRSLLVLVAVACCAGGAWGRDDAPPSRDVLRVGTKVSEPFVVQRADGSLGGLSIELWKEMARRLDVDFELRVLPMHGILDGVVTGELDAGIAAISVTPEREERMDFSHAYYLSGLGIAVSASGGGGGFLSGLLGLMTPGFWLAVGSLALLLLIVGVAAWLAEHKRNQEQFGGGLMRGIGNGFWFSAVTMTTVGYGDKAPRSVAGRVIALIWMFASIIVISTFTGTIASSITAASLQSGVQGPNDLPGARVGTVARTASAETLRDRGVAAREFDGMEEGLEALAAGTIDAFVHDAPILSYAISRGYPERLRLLDAQFELRPYAVVVPEGSANLEHLNRALLETVETAEWRAALTRWVGM